MDFFFNLMGILYYPLSPGEAFVKLQQLKHSSIFHPRSEAVVDVIVWWFDLQLPMQLDITTAVVSSNSAQGKDDVYNIM